MVSNKVLRIGINGFGRMGRLALRAGWNRPGVEFVHINEPKGDIACAAHLLEFDSIHGRWPVPVSTDEGGLRIGGSDVLFTQESAPRDIDWKANGVDLVLDCSGKFKTPDSLEGHFARGAERVVVAAPVKEGALNVVMGINHKEYYPAKHKIVTAASCTTNCLAPIVKVIRDGLGIRHGIITTIHDMTNTQTIIDAPHKDLRRARAASLSLIPTTTGSATAITMIYPDLKGKLNGIAVRVPLLNASLTDCVFEVERKTTVEEVNRLLKSAAEGELKGILGYEERPLVSIDYRTDPRSSIVDALSTMVVDDTQVKVFAWYDNEWGYVNRMIELADYVFRHP